VVCCKRKKESETAHGVPQAMLYDAMLNSLLCAASN
jgi:hypothetical protein